MSLRCGITGIANVGKTTIFNCLSSTRAESSRNAFTSTRSNIGLINVPDKRLYQLAALVKQENIIPATVEIVDIPGLTKGSSHGEGVGNKFLADIRNTDALIHVLRCFDDESLPHIDGTVDPVRDMETIELELLIKDLESVEKKIEKVEKVVKAGEKKLKHDLDILLRYKEHLESFQPARTIMIDNQEKSVVEDLFLLTAKPVLYVCNVDETSAINGNHYVESVKEALREKKSDMLILAGWLEADIAELDDPEDRRAFLEDAGLSEPGADRLVRSAYRMLNLISFFTYGPKEVKAWTIRQGTNVQQAAGVIHSDMERGFIRAEVIKFEDYNSLGSEHACKVAGKLSVEGKNYIVEDGDVIYIRFNV
ncbi:MAG: GTP-binding protein [Bacteroides sp. SM23_62_1]|nr:MAG: GTP-binding protein [Bacteroides sp. SM23_62_1]